MNRRPGLARARAVLLLLVAPSAATSPNLAQTVSINFFHTGR